MKKLLSALVITALMLSLTACSSKTTVTYGKVTAVSGSKITIQTLTKASSSGSASASGGNTDTPPDIPSGGQGDSQSAPPEKPSDDDSGGNASASEGTSGNTSTGNPPDMPSGGQSGTVQTGETETVTVKNTSVIYKYNSGKEEKADLSDITVGAVLKITYKGSKIKKILIGSESDFDLNTSAGGTGGSSASVVYDGATEITSEATQSGKTYATEKSDQSALLISTSDSVTIKNPTVTKSGDSDGGDNCNFYGQNAAVLVKDGATATVKGGTVTTNATGANGVFCYGGNGGQNGAAGDGTTVIISDTVITTTGSGSGGIMTTGGGITKASNLTVTTSGQSSAAIRTDRGGGTVTVEGGTYTTNGLGSPAIYSTADITVTDAKLVSNLSEGVCIEGLNSITLNNSNLTANNTKCNGNATFLDSVMIYQSMSGDADSGTSTFTMNGGKLTSKNGHVFHITNTNAVITLNGVSIVNKDSDNILLSVCDDGWSGGSNTATLNATAQALNGGILVGDNSTLTLTLSDGSAFKGYINGSIKNANGDTVSTEVGTVSVTLDSASTWTLTQDSYVTSFSGNSANVITNGYTLYVNGVALK